LKDERILELNEAGLLAEVVGYETDEVAAQALGSDVRTVRGSRFLDFTSGIAVHACGHGHEEIVAAVQDQASRIQHTSDVMRHAPQLELAQFLRELLADRIVGELPTIQFMNSGSESIDTAAKLALKATGRSKFIAFQGAFHGRTLFATALSCSNTAHWAAYEPFIDGIRDRILRAPAPRCRNCVTGASPDCVANEIGSLLEAHKGEVGAIFFEAQQGEGGYFPFPEHASRKIRELAQKHNVLLIADEIQSGFGRTGRWFAFDHLGVQPDIVVFGKSVGGGLPLAGIAASQKLMAKWQPGEHGTTFGGNPIACAAGLAALTIIKRDDLVERAAVLGERVKARLCKLVGSLGVHDVRGNGLMIGIELRDPAGNPDYAKVTAVKLGCRERGMLVLTCGAHIGDPAVDNSTLRLLPPLNVRDTELDRGLSILEEALRAWRGEVVRV